MSRVWVISDLHLGHKNILTFEPKLRFGDNMEEHDAILIERIRSCCNNKRDLLYILGDVCFDIERMEMLNEIPARKKLIRGNHDRFQAGVYLKYFEDILGVINYKGWWLSHTPIHPQELRGKKNIHGHVHSQSVTQRVVANVGIEYDPRYVNACVENCNGYPINMQELREGRWRGVIS